MPLRGSKAGLQEATNAQNRNRVTTARKNLFCFQSQLNRFSSVEGVGNQVKFRDSHGVQMVTVTLTNFGI